LRWHDTVIARSSGEEIVPTSRLVQWGAIGGVIAGLAWAVSDILALLFPGQEEGPIGSTSFYLIESADAIAEAGMLAALVGLHVVQARSLGRLGVVGFAVAFVGTALVLVSTLWAVILLERFGTTVPGLLFGLGLLGWLVGFVLFGIATFRARVLPRWSGLLLVAYPLVLMAGVPIEGPLILVGLLWLALGYALWTQRDMPAEQPSRVR
jgi:hypothetical protein